MQTMQGYLLAAVSGSLGRFSFDIQTGLVVGPFYPVEDPPVFIDIKEYQQAYPGTPIRAGITYDILDLGHWLISGEYEPPCLHWREERDVMVKQGELPD